LPCVISVGPLRAAAAAVLRRSSGEDAGKGGKQQGEMATSLIADSTAPPSDVHQTPYNVQVRPKMSNCNL